MLIYAAYLKEVIEVAGGDVDSDEVFVWFWNRIWDIRYFELFWTLHVLSYLNSTHCEAAIDGRLRLKVVEV